MKFETKKGMLMFFKHSPHRMIFIISVDKETTQEWYYNIKRNYFGVDEEKLDWYSKRYSELRIYHNGESK